LATIAFLAVPAHAAEEVPPTVRLTVSAAAEPNPALKYRLIQPAAERTSGNAAMFYYKSFVFDRPGSMRVIDAMTNLLEEPLAEFPLQKIAGNSALDALRKNFTELRKAARADHCDWGDDQRQVGVAAQLDHVQNLRSLCRALLLETRLRLVQDDFDGAIETLGFCYSLARDLRSGQTFIHSLIGMAIEEMAADQFEALLTRPGAPNLYWAISEFAAEPMRLRETISFERNICEYSVHGLSQLDDHELSDAEAYELMSSVRRVLDFRGNGHDANQHDLADDLQMFYFALSHYDEAGRDSRNKAAAPALANDTPLLQLVLRHRWRQFCAARDQIAKWRLVPEFDYELIKRQEHEYLQSLPPGYAVPFAGFLPTVSPVLDARVRADRRLALLRALEALRMHAAERGTWPATLAEIRGAPAALDPVTNKPFIYRAEGDQARLEAPANGREPADSSSMIYLLTLRRPAASPQTSGD
jgi:hypothetical protein